MSAFNQKLIETIDWFITKKRYDETVAGEIGVRFEQILTLLKQGQLYGQKIGSSSCSALFDSFSRQLPIVRKLSGENMLLTSKIEANEILYEELRAMIIIQLTNP